MHGISTKETPQKRGRRGKTGSPDSFSLMRKNQIH